MDEYKMLFANWVDKFGLETAVNSLEWFEDLTRHLIESPVSILNFGVSFGSQQNESVISSRDTKPLKPRLISWSSAVGARDTEADIPIGTHP
jgi:hypothetical protein